MAATPVPDVLDVGQGYESLSVRDLLEARDLYHNHLTGKPNVVGTAIGLYLQDDADLKTNAAHATGHRAPPRVTPRRLEDARERPDSWPCVIAFVSEWAAPDAFGGGGKRRPDDAIPTRLFMPDGRVVPVCIVLVTPAEAPPPPPPTSVWPDTVIGGGYPLIVETQGQEHVASVGCLVTDGHTTYALTNRHVCGPAGTPIYAKLRGQRVRIGVASGKQLTHLPFSEVYSAYPGLRTWLTLDAGMVELDDLTNWTSQIYGLGEPGSLADISERTVSLRLIGAEVQAFGAASGQVTARIKALFYRYKALGGFDYVADFLIAPMSAGGPQTEPGDSGTIWTLAPALGDTRRRPLAMEWGGQSLRLMGASPSVSNFALATALSSVCRLLDVEIVTDHNTGFRLYWGSEGHYTIAALACAQVADPKLKAWMAANQNSIAYDVTKASPDDIASNLKQAKSGGFIALADVPDIVWKQNPKQVPGGRDTVWAGKRWGGPEHPTHYADVDQPGPDGRTLLAASLADPAHFSVASWQAFYDAAGFTAKDETSRGLLPFRVWQFFDAMVVALRAHDAARFICAAGILSHYVGDACQPLHGSIYSDGYPDGQSTRTVHHKDGSTDEVSVKRGAGVHSTYEEAMIDDRSEELLAGIPAALKAAKKLPLVTSGHEAAVAILQLMDRAQKTIPPKSLVDAYIAAGGGKSKAVRDALWDQFGQKTITVMADGARVLAMLWDSAWAQGGALPGAAQTLDLKKLQALYEDPQFVPSLDLDHIGAVLAPGAAAPLPAAPKKPAARTRRKAT